MSRKNFFFAFLFILLGSFLAYGNTLGHDFIWDDLILIVDSDALRKAENLGAFFTTPFFKLAAGINFPHHRPMVSLLIYFTSVFSGTNPFGYHFLNIILHALVTGLFYLFLGRLGIKESLRVFATALFLFHPVHAEVVAWPCSAAVLAGGIFFMLGLLSSLRIRETAGSARVSALLGTAVSYMLGLLSYDLVLVLPAVILFFDFLKPVKGAFEKPAKFKLLELGLLTLIALGFLWMRYKLADGMGGFARFQHGDPNAANILLSNLPGESAAAILNVLSRYLELLLFPLVLNPEVYFPAVQFSFSALASLFLFMLVCVFVLTRKPADKNLFLFSLSWLVLALLPLGQLIFQGGLFADRYLYFASLGFCVWLTLSLEALWNAASGRSAFFKRKTAAVLAVMLCFFYGFRTFDQNKIWRDDLTFWNAASVLSPQKPRVHHLRGVSLLRFGYPEEALESFQKAVQLSPDYPHPYQGMAFALRELGKNAEADSAERQAGERYQKLGISQGTAGGKA